MVGFAYAVHVLSDYYAHAQLHQNSTPSEIVLESLKEVALPVLLNIIPEMLGVPIPSATAEHLNVMIIGALIIFFLVVEPHGLARFWQVIREKLIIWPFPH